MKKQRKPIQTVKAKISKTLRKYVVNEAMVTAQILRDITPYIRPAKRPKRKSPTDLKFQRLLKYAKSKDYQGFCIEFAKIRDITLTKSQNRRLAFILKKCMGLLA